MRKISYFKAHKKLQLVRKDYGTDMKILAELLIQPH